MNARQLEIFRAVMQTGSITGAARMLNVSQPTVSKILHHAQGQLGLQLFRNVRGRLYPTREAEMFFPDADRVFRDLTALRRLADDLRAGEGGLIRIAASSSLAAMVMPMAVAKFRRIHPRVKVITHMFPAVDTAEMVRTHQADIGLTLSQQNLHTLVSSNLGSIEMVCIFPKGHRLRKLDRITPKDLAGETLISFSSENNFGQLLDAAFLQHGITRQVDIQVTMSTIAAAITCSDAGVAIVDRFTVADNNTHVEWRRFSPEVLLPINLLTSETQTWTRFRTSLIEVIEESIKELKENIPHSSGLLATDAARVNE